MSLSLFAAGASRRRREGHRQDLYPLQHCSDRRRGQAVPTRGVGRWDASARARSTSRSVAAALRRSRRRTWPGRTSCTLSYVEYCGNAGGVQWLQLKVVHSCARPSRGARARQLAVAVCAPRDIAAALETSRERARSWALVHVPRGIYGCGRLSSSRGRVHTYLMGPSPNRSFLPRGGNHTGACPVGHMKDLHGPRA